MPASSRYVYLPPQSPRLAVLSPRVAKRFPQAKLAPSRDELRVTFGEWTMRIVDLREPWVAQEAREHAAKAPTSARAALERASHRLELYDAGDVEAATSHFNEGLLLWEFLLELPGAVGLDPVSGDFSAPSLTGVPPRSVAAKKPAKKSAARSTRKPARKPASRTRARKPARAAKKKKR